MLNTQIIERYIDSNSPRYDLENVLKWENKIHKTSSVREFRIPFLRDLSVGILK